MKVSATLLAPLPQIRDKVNQLETVGYDMCSTFELNGDPFLPAMLAAEHSNKPKIATSIAVAFARSPMTVAMTAWEINEYSAGRFVLGLGSQIKAHITRRFSMPWSHPAARMLEFIQALHAIPAYVNDAHVHAR
jgi:alkanesulfonate monooxygenase SsuD/methylene tetrahydromethanopterin reductase-like flavin-dependent oxidoreductase (luciferase family)